MYIKSRLLYKKDNFAKILQNSPSYNELYDKITSFIAEDISYPDSEFKNAKYISSPFNYGSTYTVYVLDQNKDPIGNMIFSEKDGSLTEFEYFNQEKAGKVRILLDETNAELNIINTGKIYGIVNDTNIRTDGFLSHDLPYIDEINWNTMNSICGAKNHCGPTSASNVLLYYSKKLKFSLPENIHEITRKFMENMSTGKLGTPIKKYTKGIENYIFKALECVNIASGISYTYGWKYIKHQINEDNMLSAYRWSTSFIKGAHYVNYIGWREYHSGERFIRVLNEWDKNTNHFIRYNLISRIHSPVVFTFEISKNDSEKSL